MTEMAKLGHTLAFKSKAWRAKDGTEVADRSRYVNIRLRARHKHEPAAVQLTSAGWPSLKTRRQPEQSIYQSVKRATDESDESESY